MQRRRLLQAGVTASVLYSSSRLSQGIDQQRQEINEKLSTSFTTPVFIATWPFGKNSCDRAIEVLRKTKNMRDAIELGIHVTELDEKNQSVGVGGLPNAAGVVQLDASFMDGKNQQSGAVAGLEGYPNPISVARKVMEETKHVMLVGSDAAAFAKQKGFETRELLTPAAKKRWEKWMQDQSKGIPSPESHDTIAMLGIDDTGHLVGGCSTSGLAFKLPGRVGDSPIIGSGLYVDGEVGAAGATGVGENVMRYCGSFLIVEFMRQGMTPTEACVATIKRIVEGEGKPASELSVNFIAINKQGHVGAAGTDNFAFGVSDANKSVVLQSKRV